MVNLDQCAKECFGGNIYRRVGDFYVGGPLENLQGSEESSFFRDFIKGQYGENSYFGDDGSKKFKDCSGEFEGAELPYQGVGYASHLAEKLKNKILSAWNKYDLWVYRNLDVPFEETLVPKVKSVFGNLKKKKELRRLKKVAKKGIESMREIVDSYSIGTKGSQDGDYKLGEEKLEGKSSGGNFSRRGSLISRLRNYSSKVREGWEESRKDINETLDNFRSSQERSQFKNLAKRYGIAALKTGGVFLGYLAASSVFGEAERMVDDAAMKNLVGIFGGVSKIVFPYWLSGKIFKNFEKNKLEGILKYGTRTAITGFGIPNIFGRGIEALPNVGIKKFLAQYFSNTLFYQRLISATVPFWWDKASNKIKPKLKSSWNKIKWPLAKIAGIALATYVGGDLIGKGAETDIMQNHPYLKQAFESAKELSKVLIPYIGSGMAFRKPFRKDKLEGVLKYGTRFYAGFQYGPEFLKEAFELVPIDGIRIGLGQYLYKAENLFSVILGLTSAFYRDARSRYKQWKASREE